MYTAGQPPPRPRPGAPPQHEVSRAENARSTEQHASAPPALPDCGPVASVESLPGEVGELLQLGHQVGGWQGGILEQGHHSGEYLGT